MKPPHHPLTSKERKADNIIISWSLRHSRETFKQGLPDKYDNICGIIHHRESFPDLKTAHLMLTTEEIQLKSKSLYLAVDSLSSSPIVLMAESGTTRRPSNPQIKSSRPCYNSAKGKCRFGDGCKFVHDVNVKTSDNSSLETKAQPNYVRPTIPLGFTYPPAQQNTSTQPFVPTQQIACQVTGPAQQIATTQIIINPAQVAPQVVHSVANPCQRDSRLPQDMRPHYLMLSLPGLFMISLLAHEIWIQASSHLNDYVTNLSEVFNSCTYPSVSGGDGHSIPVTNTGHSILPTPFRSLYFNNMLVTPHIVKNSIFVRQTGDLYLVTAQSLIRHTLLVSQHMWHQRLGHSGSKVLHRLVSNIFISCNKEKPPVLCHACQLGKHMRLPLINYNTMVTSCFDIIHSDRLNLHVSSVSYLPKSYHDAFNDLNWTNAMRDELNALNKNSTWTLVPRPTDTNIVRCMWLFCHNYLADGTLNRYKALLVVNGSKQLDGVDVDEILVWLLIQETTSGYCVCLGNNLLSWSSKRQATLSRSSVEVEYLGVANAVAETCWLGNILRKLYTPLSSATLV
nr:ribonuclease H-like domain-containing protein [Tanacetum cinerariifolium]GEX14633.1 ribonuclease H-like domain-containing protein [Tanacetum cinerariifolium]